MQKGRRRRRYWRSSLHRRETEERRTFLSWTSIYPPNLPATSASTSTSPSSVGPNILPTLTRASSSPLPLSSSVLPIGRMWPFSEDSDRLLCRSTLFYSYNLALSIRYSLLWMSFKRNSKHLSGSLDSIPPMLFLCLLQIERRANVSFGGDVRRGFVGIAADTRLQHAVQCHLPRLHRHRSLLRSRS